MTPSGTAWRADTEQLVEGRLDELVPAPAFFALAHFTYEPGAFFPPAKGNGPVVFRVLAGTLQFEAERAATKTGVGGQPQGTTPGRPFTVTIGDQLVMPGGVLHTAQTVGQEAARTLGLAVFSEAPAQQFPPGISFDPLVLGQVAALPAAPARATVTRLKLADNQAVDAHCDGPQLVHVEAGQCHVVLGSGAVSAWHGIDPFARAVPLSPDEPVDLSLGDGLILQSDAFARLTALHNDTSILVAAVTPGFPNESNSQLARADEVVRRYFRTVVDAADPDAAAVVFAAHSYHHDRPPEQQGLAGLQAALRVEFATLSDAATRVDDTFGDEDVVLHRWTRTARHTGTFHGVPRTGRAIAASGLTLSRVRHGQVVEDWEAQDVAEQIRLVSGSAPVGDLEAGVSADSAETTRAAATRYVYDLWHRGDLSLVDVLFAPDFINHTLLPGQQPGRAGIRQFVRRWREAFPDVIVTIDLLVASSGQAAIRWTSRGHQDGPILGVAPAGRYVTVSGITVLRVHEGRIAEQWQQWDVLSFLDQAAAAPHPALPASPTSTP